MKGGYIYLMILIVGFTGVSCRKVYSPAIISAPNSLLIVEGVINPGADSTFIKLSHTVKLYDTVKIAPEKGALIIVEGKGISRPLTEVKPGVYSALPLNLDTAQQYHLRIKLSNGKEYISDEAKARLTPPIDTITYTTKNNALQINASAHDPANNTQYYRWDYDEAWRFNAKYFSSYKVIRGKIRARFPSEDIYSCFNSNISSTINIASSVKLDRDVITEAPIITIPATSEKISIRYSILIRQYALTKEGYNFYENLKKNTEQLGSIFDALPSEIRGNVHNIANAAEPVLGYVGVGTVQQKRIYINKTDLPAAWVTKYPYNCTEDPSLYNNPDTHLNEVKAFILSDLSLPTHYIPGPNNDTLGYYRSSFICGDCTLRGTKKQPAFWKDK